MSSSLYSCSPLQPDSSLCIHLLSLEDLQIADRQAVEILRPVRDRLFHVKMCDGSTARTSW
jgi:hypothetical protein